MNEIVILYDLPMIMTKQQGYKPNSPAKGGSIVILPEDAVLVTPPVVTESKAEL